MRASGNLSRLLFTLLIYTEVFPFLPSTSRGDEIKVGTLAPTSSKWVQMLMELSETVMKKSQGKVKITIYPGGIMGDEEEMIRKIRIGQLHAGAFIISGIKKIAPQLGVLDLPFLFRNYGEVDFILRKFEREFSDYFTRGGFKPLIFTEHGFVYFFSKRADVNGFRDLGRTRFWGWKGDETIAGFIKLLGTAPIYVPVPDLLLALETAMVESFQTTPLSCISLQWCKLSKVFINYPYRYELAVLAISSSFWERLPSDTKEHIEQAIAEEKRKYGGNINRVLREEQERAKLKLKEMGIRFVIPLDREEVEGEVRRKIWFSEGASYPHDLLHRIIRELENFRRESR